MHGETILKSVDVWGERNSPLSSPTTLHQIPDILPFLTRKQVQELISFLLSGQPFSKRAEHQPNLKALKKEGALRKLLPLDYLGDEEFDHT